MTGLPAASCLAGDLTEPSWDDTRADPASGDGYFYLVRAQTGCDTGGFGTGREALDPLNCGGP